MLQLDHSNVLLYDTVIRNEETRLHELYRTVFLNE